MSGVAIQIDQDKPVVAEVGARIRLFVAEVGFVNGRVVRQNSRLFAVQFLLTPGLEHDLLIRKLFTLERSSTAMRPTAMTATRAMLTSIVKARARPPDRSQSGGSGSLEARLPREALVIRPRPQAVNLPAFAMERRMRAA